MYLTAGGSFSRVSPATLFPLVLLREPRLQRLEVFEQRAAVHLPLPGHHLEGVRPRLARAQREHRPQPLSRLLAAEEGALVQRALVARGLAHGAIELELEDVGEEVARVRRVAGHVVLGAGIEVLLAARDRRRDALVPLPQRPPGLLVISGRGLAS